MTKLKEETKTVETVIDAEALKSISEAVVAGITPVIDEKVKTAIEASAPAPVVKTTKKNVNGGDDPAEDGEEEATDEQKAIAKESKEKRLVKAAIALVNGDSPTLKAYNTFALAQIEKAGYANSATNADGGYIIADPEFEAEIEKLSEVYGVAFQEANVRPISKNSIKTNKRGSNVTMYETGEGVAKTGTKLTITQTTVELRKFAAIAIATDELDEDAAIDFWAEVADGFAEERARIADEMVFTDTNVTYPGITEHSGVIVESTGTSDVNDIDWDTLMNAEVAVPTRAMKNGKHYMHRTIWNIVRKSKDGSSRYQLVPAAGLITPWGTPVKLVDVMPASTAVGANGTAGIFGDLKRVRFYVKRGLVLAKSNEATVTDADSNEVKLFEQDMTALRAVTRMVALIKFPEAFCIYGTGTVS